MHLTAPSNWSRSIGTGGRDPSEQVVTIAGMRKGSTDHEWSLPSETEQRCEKELVDEVIELKAKSPAWCPLRGSQGENHDGDQSGHAASFQHQSDRHFVGHPLVKGDRRPTNVTTRLLAGPVAPSFCWPVWLLRNSVRPGIS